jgi:hypothetical protein
MFLYIDMTTVQSWMMLFDFSELALALVVMEYKSQSLIAGVINMVLFRFHRHIVLHGGDLTDWYGNNTTG